MLDEINILRACKDPVFLAKFWAKVAKGDGCWAWTGGKWKTGYGFMQTPKYCKRKIVRATHVAWVTANGNAAIPDGLLVLHSCDNPPCVNPAHLRAGTQKENLADCVSRGRYRSPQASKTHCKRGHPFDEANTRHSDYPSGPRRVCRTCHRATCNIRRDAKVLNPRRKPRTEVP